jgi:hypothetical protein
MTFEFVIVYQEEEGTPIRDVLVDRLGQVLTDNLNEFDFDTVDAMVRVNYERRAWDEFGEVAPDDKRALLGFTLELPDETATASIREVVDEFAAGLAAAPIEHAVKYEDPLLRTELAMRAAELFALEMKLRRVLSIYLHAYPKADPYDLLTEECVQPMAKDKPQKEQMKAAAENQFFHLTFGQYVGLNQRPAIKDLVSLIRNEEAYESFRAELLRQPVEHEDDASFLAGLKERMDVIEKMRNAVAHNRCPPKKTTNDYLNALPLVNQALDDYLAALAIDWRDSMDTGECIEDEKAQEAVDWALEHSKWDKTTKTITLYDADDDRIRSTVSNREELEEHLRNVAEEAYYSHVPGDSSDVAGTCHADGYVQEALEPIEEELEAFFGDKEEAEPER